MGNRNFVIVIQDPLSLLFNIANIMSMMRSFSQMDYNCLQLIIFIERSRLILFLFSGLQEILEGWNVPSTIEKPLDRLRNAWFLNYQRITFLMSAILACISSNPISLTCMTAAMSILTSSSLSSGIGASRSLSPFSKIQLQAA